MVLGLRNQKAGPTGASSSAAGAAAAAVAPAGGGGAATASGAPQPASRTTRWKRTVVARPIAVTSSATNWNGWSGHSRVPQKKRPKTTRFAHTVDAYAAACSRVRSTRPGWSSGSSERYDTCTAAHPTLKSAAPVPRYAAVAPSSPAKGCRPLNTTRPKLTRTSAVPPACQSLRRPRPSDAIWHSGPVRSESSPTIGVASPSASWPASITAPASVSLSPIDGPSR